MRAAFRIAVLLMAVAAVCHADKVTLKDGRVYEGVVLSEDDATIKIKTSRATLTFRKDQVESVERSGGGPVQEREKRLEALDPSRPTAYLELAQWMSGQGAEAFDLPTFRRACAAASKLDRNLAYDAQMTLGRKLAEIGQRREAAAAFTRAGRIRPDDGAAKKWLDDLQGGLRDDARKQIEELRTALETVANDDLPAALPRLRRCTANALAEKAKDYLGMTWDAFLKDVARRVKCEPCDGTALVKCPACEGKGVYTCSVCLGSGEKKTFTAGKDKFAMFANSVCRTCYGLRTVLCAKCKAERWIVISLLYAKEPDSPKDKRVKTTGGEEASDLGSEIDLGSYKSRDGGFVTGMTAEVVVVGGRTPCGTCGGVKYDPPADPVNKAGVNLYIQAATDVVEGRAAYDVVGPTNGDYDEQVLSDGKLRYKEGKWTK